MMGAVDEPHAGTTQRLRGRQASETTPDDDDLFVRHEREPETGYGVPRSTPALRLTLLLYVWIDSVIELLRIDTP
jgi:hypothetical protein